MVVLTFQQNVIFITHVHRLQDSPPVITKKGLSLPDGRRDKHTHYHIIFRAIPMCQKF